MDSPDSGVGHLDANAGRDVVYCHNCAHEWYRDEHGLHCPACDGDITEIISPDNDPREYDHPSSASTSPEMPHLHHYHEDSDPDEADIEEHVGAGQYGFNYQRRQQSGEDNNHHHNPEVNPVLERFLDMIQGFGSPRQPGGGRGFPSREFVPLGGARIQRTTFTTGRNGTTSVTIVSAPGVVRSGQPFPGHPAEDPFQSLFADVLRDVGPVPDDEHPGAPPGLARSLHDILNLFNPSNAVAGDAVYSQEALDRIITSLMEANPQSNAAPPASDEALQKLERREVNKEMLAANDCAECAICIDAMKEGETAAVLPCKHLFHEDCVILWLKEHNTCPVCRTPMDKTDPGGQGADGASGSQGPPGAGRSTNPSDAGQNRASPSPFSPNGERGYGGPGNYDAGLRSAYQNREFQSLRPPNQSQSPLNEALRSISYMQREQERQRDRAARSSGMDYYDTSRMQQRRTSLSPTSPRAFAPAEQAARMRQRSPSNSSRREAYNGSGGEGSGGRSDDGQRQSSHGPLSWLRDRFTGGGRPNQGSSRDGRNS